MVLETRFSVSLEIGFWLNPLLEYQFTGIPTCLLINTRICNKEDIDMVS